MQQAAKFGFRRRAALVTLSAFVALIGPALAQGPDVERPEVERRVEELLARMTLEEKVGQLHLQTYVRDLDPELLRQGLVGAVMNYNDPAELNAIRAAVRQSRLGIPVLTSLDVVHGYRTLFPMPIAEAATFDPGLARLASLWAAREASAAGIHWTFGPMADVSRDVRWGRLNEGAGEDPYLTSVFTRARIEGFHEGGLATSTKHFAGYGGSVGGRDYDQADIPPAEFRDTHLPPFRAAVEAGTEIMMSAFIAIDGVPTAANRWLLTDVLRHEWGFRGFVVSDFNGVGELIQHGVAGSEAEAARIGITAGVDMEMGSGLYGRHLPALVRSGQLPQAVVDEAARRVLRVKFGLGLFDRPPLDPAAVAAAQLTPEARAAAREVARESFVLLRNEGDTLPIPASVRRIAVVGPFAVAARDQNGPHEARGATRETITVLEGISRRAAAAGLEIAHAPACDVLCRSSDGFAEAVEAAKSADFVVAVLGEPRDLTGEGGSRAHLTLPGRQEALVAALAATGKPLALVLMGGRPLELRGAVAAAPAILMTWYPGTEGGPAVADVLFGDVNPSGKLPHTWPRTLGQVPIHYERRPSGRPFAAENRFTLKFVDEDHRPLHPFGFGLSYTRFSISDLEVITPRLTSADTVVVRVAVTNTGERAGKEVVQLYVRDPVASRSRPLRQLKASQKVALAPGERQVLTLRVPARDLGFHLPDGRYVVEPGLFQVFVGNDADAALSGEFTLVERAEASRTGGIEAR